MAGPGLPRLAITAGEPAGIGPEIVARLATTSLPADLILVGDPELAARGAARCGLALQLVEDDRARLTERKPGSLRYCAKPLRVTEVPGEPDPRNAFHVLGCLAHATDACLAGDYDALVTAPVHKAVINASGESFTGHTEFLAERAGAEVAMMLASDTLRVVLATTHLPLADVPKAITAELLERILRIAATDLRDRFGISEPRIAVLGLNPHAGEGGYLGREEIEIIEPLLQRLRGAGMHLIGPLPADTAFTAPMRDQYDAVLAMYHDQALPVLKAEAFDRAINITLGLPFIRTSVDHGTALDLAGNGKAKASSLIAAAELALRLVARR